jgi:dTDP-glucose pyrophosphorylase
MHAMNDFALIMPMAGRGSRFSRLGIATPKPLIEIAGKPFFWWAVQSLRRSMPLREMIFVVLDEHCGQFDIERRILALYPQARIARVPDITSGAAETAAIGLRLLCSAGPVAINDCDHAFQCNALGALNGSGQLFDADQAVAALMCFRSDNPAYSYALLDDGGVVNGTVEKRAASPYAIAGCYLFADAALFLRVFDAYRAQCPYDELFISGIYNLLAARGARLKLLPLERHWSFGTPEEYQRLEAAELVRAFEGAARS